MAAKVNRNFALVMCPPLIDYSEAPKDISHCELVSCPKCHGDMWLSEKKNKMMNLSISIKKEVILACYRCITKMAKEDPELFHHIEMMRI